MEIIKIGVCGWGNVAIGLFNAINDNKNEININSGIDIEIKVIGARRDNPKCDPGNIKIESALDSIHWGRSRPRRAFARFALVTTRCDKSSNKGCTHVVIPIYDLIASLILNNNNGRGHKNGSWLSGYRLCCQNCSNARTDGNIQWRRLHVQFPPSVQN